MLPKTKQLRADLPDTQFKQSVAEHVRDAVAILTGGVSLANMNAQILEFTASGDDTAVSVKTRFQSIPDLVLVSRVTNTSSPDTPGIYVPAWTFSGGYLVFYNFATLASGVTYTIRLVVFGGG